MCCCNPLVGSMLIDTSALDSVLPVMICLSKLFQSAVGSWQLGLEHFLAGPLQSQLQSLFEFNKKHTSKYDLLASLLIFFYKIDIDFMNFIPHKMLYSLCYIFSINRYIPWNLSKNSYIRIKPHFVE